jgi:hypothetical protein
MSAPASTDYDAAQTYTECQSKLNNAAERVTHWTAKISTIEAQITAQTTICADAKTASDASWASWDQESDPTPPASLYTDSETYKSADTQLTNLNNLKTIYESRKTNSEALVTELTTDRDTCKAAADAAFTSWKTS